jgi:hypothetical protein
MATSSGSRQIGLDGAGVAWADPDADGEPAAPVAGVRVAGVRVAGVLLAGVPLGEADPAAPLAEAPLAADVGWAAGFGPSLPQAATTTVAPSGSALPPIPLVSTK